MKTLIAAMALFGSSAFGLLSPLDQNLKELKTLFASPELRSYITTPEVIENISHTDCQYVITTNQQEMLVEVEYLPQDRPGPRQFRFIFHKPQPKGT